MTSCGVRNLLFPQFFVPMTEDVVRNVPLVDAIRYKTFSPAGDLIAVLPSMRQVYRDTGKKAIILCRTDVEGHYYDGAIHSTYSETGRAVCMSKKHWEMLVPLLEAQEYVLRCEIWNGQEFDFDLDRIREFGGTTMPMGHLYWWQPLVYPQLATDFSERFIRASGDFAVRIVGSQNTVVYSGSYVNVLRDKVIVSRSERYINQYITYHFLKPYQSQVVFAGTPKEPERFCKEWDLDVPYLEVKNFLELTRCFQSCRFAITNQTMSAHLLNGIGKKRLLEVCPNVPNTWPTTKHGYPFMHQISLQYYFEKFINE
jgi:hypothetical protein